MYEPERWQLYRQKPLEIRAKRMSEDFVVNTLEGVMKGNAGDYLIRRIKGEEYPCQKDIFEATYEGVEVI